MLFNSFTFVFFLSAVVALTFLPLSPAMRKLHLLAASYVFYAAWNVQFVTLLFFSTAINWIAGELCAIWDDRTTARKLVLWTTVALNIGLLAFFKYGNDLLALWHTAASHFGIVLLPPTTPLALPIGLSFFTFQSLSYTIDVYRRTIKPAESIVDFAIFVSFFPVLLAGPLLRAGQFLPQCARIRRASSSELGWGSALFLLGLFLKVTLADHLLAPIVRHIFDPLMHPDALSAWTGTLAFAAQDYCDFAGYSTCAMGIACCLGFTIPANFRAPFASIGFRDLWQRWHITLVAWMRDYVFNSLGGVYKGYARAAANVMLVMLLIGLWHAASWTYLLFGFLHGIYLIGETYLLRTRLRRFPLWRSPVGKLLLWIGTMTLCLIAFVFYRATSVQQSRSLLAAMIGSGPAASTFRLSDSDLLVIAAVIGPMVIAHWICRNVTLPEAVARVPWWAISVGLALLLVAVTLSSGESQSFLYFQY